MQLSIIIPCFNEEKNIPFILQSFQNVIKKEDMEVILVNNGSTDKTAELLEQLAVCKNSGTDPAPLLPIKRRRV